MTAARAYYGAMLTACAAIVFDVLSSWWLQTHGGHEINPTMIPIEHALGLAGMLALIVAAKLAVLVVLALSWQLARKLRAEYQWAIIAVAVLYVARITIPLAPNLRSLM